MVDSTAWRLRAFAPAEPPAALERELVSKLDAEFFERLERMGGIVLHGVYRGWIEGLLRGFVVPTPSPEEVRDQLAAEVKHADALVGLMSSGFVPLGKPDTARLLDLLRELARNGRDLVDHDRRLQRRGRGRPKHAELEALVVDLAGIYRAAGGYITVAWGDQQRMPTGGFPGFLRVIYEVLPTGFRPPTAETFARLARTAVPKALHGAAPDEA